MKMKEMKRTRNITVFAVITIALAIALTILFILMYLHPRPSKTYTRYDWFLRILPILYLVCGVGILKLKNWARCGVIILAAISLAFFVPCLILILPGASISLPSLIVLTVLFFLIIGNGLILWFFNRTSIKEQFQKAAKTKGG